ncbi:lipopolysaccharide cholinephosphotransferase [Aequitasia blattaphilus]|uniref:LicD family protein n=1 Tax=Aequitasia blattaphilus TaxID=2949332 RepID=A0ABT1E6A9_9FIRM|nr:LicD family protein [Aequitasia blattaphilus]MCP1101375.1 LicD family protein [Aequitasia blattaphilus]MCR8614015.1 LicD family protein [Aequitasia blattaphilus]
MRKYSEFEEYDKEILDKLHKTQIEILNEFKRICKKHDLNYFIAYGSAIGAVRHRGFIPWDDDIDVAMPRKDYMKFMSLAKKELADKYFLMTPEIDKRYACTVTHLEMKGTIFVSEMNQDLKCEQGIFMDIFPLDFVAENKVKEKWQGLSTNFWGRLLFLSGTAYPIVPVKGVFGLVLRYLCVIIHYMLKLFHISPAWIYKRFQKSSMSSYRKGGTYVTSFEYAGAIKDKVKYKDLFPLKEVKFEDTTVNIPSNNHEFLTKVYGDYLKMPPVHKRVNHMPIIIGFEGEEPIYKNK